MAPRIARGCRADWPNLRKHWLDSIRRGNNASLLARERLSSSEWLSLQTCGVMSWCLWISGRRMIGVRFAGDWQVEGITGVNGECDK